MWSLHVREHQTEESEECCQSRHCARNSLCPLTPKNERSSLDQKDQEKDPQWEECFHGQLVKVVQDTDTHTIEWQKLEGIETEDIDCTQERPKRPGGD